MSNFLLNLMNSTSDKTKSRLVLRLFSFFAILIADIELSTPTTSPAAPTFAATLIVIAPVPHARSRTVCPARTFACLTSSELLLNGPILRFAHLLWYLGAISFHVLISRFLYSKWVSCDPVKFALIWRRLLLYHQSII